MKSKLLKKIIGSIIVIVGFLLTMLGTYLYHFVFNWLYCLGIALMVYGGLLLIKNSKVDKYKLFRVLIHIPVCLLVVLYFIVVHNPFPEWYKIFMTIMVPIIVVLFFLFKRHILP